MSRLLLLSALFALPHWCGAAETCLWLNEATAAGILGGPVSLRVFHPAHSASAAATANAKSSAGPINSNASAPNYVAMSTDDEDCAFTRRDSAAAGQIRIEVRTTNESATDFTSRVAECGKDKDSLHAIGNEAVACETKQAAASNSQQASERVIGRVRDRVFVVSVSANEIAKSRLPLRESAKAAAQIVAGNLF